MGRRKRASTSVEDGSAEQADGEGDPAEATPGPPLDGPGGKRLRLDSALDDSGIADMGSESASPSLLVDTKRALADQMEEEVEPSASVVPTRLRASKLRKLPLGELMSVVDPDMKQYYSHIAAKNGNVECLVALVELGAGATLLATNAHDETPAHLAALNGHSACLEALAKYDPRALTAVNKDGATAAHWSVCGGGHVDCLAQLCKHGAGVTLLNSFGFERTPADVAVTLGYASCLEFIAEYGGVDVLKIPSSFGNRNTLAHTAAEANSVACLDVLAKIGAASLFCSKNCIGETPMHRAAWGDRVVEFINALVRYGAEATLWAVTNDGLTPMHYAAQNVTADAVDALIAHGAASTLVARDNNGCLPIHHAARADPDMWDSPRKVPRPTGCFEALVAHGVSHGIEGMLFAVDNSGENLAHKAATGGNVAVLHALARHGAGAMLSAPIDDSTCNTPAHIAAMNGHVDVIEALVEHGAGKSLFDDLRTPAHCAAICGHSEILEALAKHGAKETLSAKANGGVTPAHFAALRGNAACIEVLGRFEVPLDDVNSSNRTPAYIAAMFDHADVLRALVTHGWQCASSLVRSRAVDRHGDPSPTHVAAAKGHLNCLEAIARTCCRAGGYAQRSDWDPTDADLWQGTPEAADCP
eukprot:m.84898 g.84898  ORF g.84898 m.84898 type:complete len:645 (-) comp11334_c0_seq1:1838-3772(-)